MENVQQKSRDTAFEFLRGCASLIVVFGHITAGFAPALSGLFPNMSPELCQNRWPWFGFLNGTAAVLFFFVLSGYILTRSSIQTGCPEAIIRNSVKRWPRLAILTLIVVLGSYFCFKLNLYRFEEVGSITKSEWLSRFAYAYDLPFRPQFSDAFMQGAFWTFFRGDTYYDTSLWTMHYEFVGSFIAFGLALFFIASRSKSYLCYVAIVCIFLFHFVENYRLVAFPVGVILATLVDRRYKLKSVALTIASLAFSVYLLGYSGIDVGVFHPLHLLVGRYVDQNYIWIAGSVILIMIGATSGPFRDLTNNRAARFLGWISFPLYLVHVLVICSAACFTYLAFEPGSVTAIIAATAVTLLLSISISIPLAIINDRWIALLNGIWNLPQNNEDISSATGRVQLGVTRASQ